MVTVVHVLAVELVRELRAFNRPFVDPTGRYELTNEEWAAARIAELEIELNLAKNLDPSGEFYEPDW